MMRLQCFCQEISKVNNKLYIVAGQNEAEGSHRDVTNLSSSREKADTKLILHAVSAIKMVQHN